jgi:plastocyanin
MNRFRLAVLVAVLSVVTAACGGAADGTDKSSSSAGNSFVLDEWSIRPADLVNGKIRVTATNMGTETHELIIVRGSDPKALPTKPDGSVDEDKILAADLVGEIPDVASAKSATKTFDLTAGEYLAFCNIVDTMGMGDGMGDGMGHGGMGHVHYQLGMVTTFTVT